MKAADSAIEIHDLYYKYEKEFVLEKIHLEIPQGAFLGVIGPNGSGKSTLLKLILGLLKLQKGEIKIFGKDIQRFRDWQLIGFVSQKANSFNTGFPATVREVVSSGLTKKIGLFKFMNQDDRQKVYRAVEAVELAPFIDRNIGELSGGQQQRAFIARALVSEPKILILDEPTVGVDVQHIQSFYGMLEDLNKKNGMTLILVTHDITALMDKLTHVACLNRTMLFYGTTEEFKFGKSNLNLPFLGYDIELMSHFDSYEGVRQ